MFERIRQRQLISVGTLERISFRDDSPIIGIRARPSPASLRERRERFPHSDNGGVAAALSRKGNDVIAMRPDNFQRLIIAAGKNLGKL